MTSRSIRETSILFSENTEEYVNLFQWIPFEMHMIMQKMLINMTDDYYDLLTLIKFLITQGNLSQVVSIMEQHRDTSYDLDRHVWYVIVMKGELELLKWAKKHGYNSTEWICERAASKGRLDILIWARENGCPLNEDICTLAAGKDHLNVLIWAKEHGCPWSRKTYIAALEGNHSDVLEWLKINGDPEWFDDEWF